MANNGHMCTHGDYAYLLGVQLAILIPTAHPVNQECPHPTISLEEGWAGGAPSERVQLRMP